MSHSVPRPIQLGLCCMNVTLKQQKVPVYAARRIIIKTIEKLGIEELKKRTLQNLDDLLKMLQWNEENGIRVFRLSSEMFQHKTNPRVQDYTYDFALEHLKRIGDYAKEKGHRLTFHPGQFNNLGSPRQKVVEQTFKDLEYHADVLDLLGFQYDTPHGRNSVMVIHGGGVYGDKKGAMKRWVENYHKLPDKIKNRLVLENCEKCYSIVDCLELWAKTGVPVVLDTHHFECYKQLHPDEKFRHPSEYIPMILESWTDKKMKPKFHVSEQGSGKIGHHSDYIEILPQYLLDIPEKYGIDIDIMIEAKMKELSIQKLYEKYPQCNCKFDLKVNLETQNINMITNNTGGEKINLYGTEYQNCQQRAKEFEESEIGEYYKSKLCLKKVGGLAPARKTTLNNHFSKIDKFVSNTFEEVESHQQQKKCVLPKGHSGPCSCTMNIFKDNPTTSKVIGKIEQSIYSTPGADDYVIKNRDSRLHPIAITKTQEKGIKNKKVKLSCSIPLKEQSTPNLLATGYLDYLTYTTNIEGFQEYINKESPHYIMCKKLLEDHKKYLIDHFNKFNRNIFDSDGYTICAVLGKRLSVSDLADPSRDNRTDIRPTDIQLGHITSRCEYCYTIYGTNIVMMTRRGNLIIGEHSFIEDIWISELQAICNFHNP